MVSVTFRNVSYEFVRDIEPMDRFFFIAGRQVAVVKDAFAAGQHRFDYQVNSRDLDSNGHPQSIATTERALEEQYQEKTAILRGIVPIIINNHQGRKLSISLSSPPEIFESTESGNSFAWSIKFKLYEYAGGIDGGGKFAKLKLAIPRAQLQYYKVLPGGFGTVDIIGTR